MSIDNKFIHSVKSQGSMEYILIISAIAIVIVVAIAFVLLTGGKATSSGSYKGEILNATMVYSPAGDNIGPGNLSNSAYPTTEYLLLATNYPLPNIPKNTNSNLFLIDFSTDYYPGYNEWGVPYNQGNITEVYSQNGEYVYAVNFTYWTNDYLHSELPINYVGIWNLNTNKTTVFISNPKPLKVNFVETNSSYVSLLPSGNIGKNVSNNVTFIETGLPIGSSFTLSYYNLSQSYDYYDYAVDNAIINVNSTKMTITTKATQGYYLTSSVTNSINYGGINYYVSPNSLSYTAGSTIYYNYYTLPSKPLEYTLNKPLVNGAEVTFILPNSTYYYPINPFSNLEVSVGNTIVDGGTGTQINAFVANYTQNSITLNLGNIPSGNIQTVYLNFLDGGQIGSDLWFSPEYISTNPDVNTSSSIGIFSSYSDNNGEFYQLPIPKPYNFSHINFATASTSTNYIVGINDFLDNINSIGFDINNDAVPVEYISNGGQAPYNGTYDMGSAGHIFIGIPTGSSYGNSIPTSPVGSMEDYVGPIIFNYTLLGNKITLNTEVEGSLYSYSYQNYSIPQGATIYFDDFYSTGRTISYPNGYAQPPVIYYYATSPNNVFDYTATEVGSV
jgi:hypothetical protein